MTLHDLTEKATRGRDRTHSQRTGRDGAEIPAGSLGFASFLRPLRRLHEQASWAQSLTVPGVRSADDARTSPFPSDVRRRPRETARDLERPGTLEERGAKRNMAKKRA